MSLANDNITKKVKIKILPLTDFSEKRFIDFFKVFSDFVRVKYNGTTIFIDPAPDVRYIEMWKDNICLSLYSEDRFYTDPDYTLACWEGKIHQDSKRYYHYGYIGVKLLPGESEDISILFTKQKIYEIFDEYLQILKDYKKALKGPIVRNTPVRLKKGSTSRRGRPRKNITEESNKPSNNKPRKKYYKKKSSPNKNKKTENKPS